MEFLPRFQRRSELHCLALGGLKRSFDGRYLVLDVFPCRRIRHPPCSPARMLRGEVEQQDRLLDFSFGLGLQAFQAGDQFGNVGVGGFRPALLAWDRATQRPLLEANDLQHFVRTVCPMSTRIMSGRQQIILIKLAVN